MRLRPIDIESNLEIFPSARKALFADALEEHTYNSAPISFAFRARSSPTTLGRLRRSRTSRKASRWLHSVALSPRIRSFLSSCSRDRRSPGRYKLIQVRDKISRDESLVIVHEYTTAVSEMDRLAIFRIPERVADAAGECDITRYSTDKE